MFYKIEADQMTDTGIDKDPDLPVEVSFLTGHAIAVEGVLEFETSFDKDEPPRHFAYTTIPVMSKKLVQTLVAAGVDVLQTFPAVLTNGPRLRWEGYFAVKVLGIVACADLAASTYDAIARRPDGLILGSFTDLRIDPEKAGRHEFFRLGESPGTLIASERIVDALLDEFGDQETIGMTITPLDGSYGSDLDEDDPDED